MKKQKIMELTGRYDKIMREVSKVVWEYAEPGMREYKSAKLYAELFEQQGFQVEREYLQVPTAVMASWGDSGPVVAFLGEYDALSGLSQEACSCSHKEVVPNGYGQGCGHNLLGTGAAGAALALRDYFKENHLPGTVRFYGCPGEEYGSGKTFLARDGGFDDVDICYTWHPSTITCIEGTSGLADIGVFFTFKGKTAHAAMAPELGRSALDAAELMNIGCNYLREHIISSARIHYAYENAGGSAPNVVQDYVVVNYFIRAPKVEQVMEIYDRVKDIARGAALMSGTTVEWDIYEGLSEYIPNKCLDNISQKAMEEIGAPQYTEQEYEFAREMRKTFTEKDILATAKDLEQRGMDKALISTEELICNKILPHVHSKAGIGGSTDVGDVSKCVPVSQLRVTTAVLGTPGHSWQMTSQGMHSIAWKGTMFAAAAMALSAAEACEHPEIIEEAKKEFLQETGGVYNCPLPKDKKPL